MRKLLACIAILAPTLAHAVYHEEERRFLCIGKQAAALDLVDDDKQSGKLSTDADGWRWIVTTQGDSINITQMGTDYNWFESCRNNDAIEFSCEPADGDMFTKFYFSTETKRFLMYYSMYWRTLVASREPFMVAGECTEF